MTSKVPGPTYAELLHPRGTAPNDLYRIGWTQPLLEFPRELSGVEARILVMLGYAFPSGSHKVGATYAIVMEAEKDGLVHPGRTTLIGPSTGNFGIGTAWTAYQKGYRGVVVMPDGMSPERTERIRQYGSEIVFTPGTESDVILTIEKAKAMGQEEDTFVLAQFESFANYRFHHHVTGNAALEKAGGPIRAFVSAPGSAGTIAAADRIKEVHPDAIAVAAEPLQCSTLYDGGQGQHRIEGIGDKMAPFILNVTGLDRLVLVDDRSCVDLLHHLVASRRYRYEFGISGICNVIAAIQTAKAEGFGGDDVIVTVATDGLDRYHGYMAEYPPLTAERDAEARARWQGLRPERYLDVSTPEQKERLHRLKESLWSRWCDEAALRRLRDPDTWRGEAARVAEYDRR